MPEQDEKKHKSDMGDFIEVVLNILTKTPGEDSNTWLGWLLETCRKSRPILSEPDILELP